MIENACAYYHAPHVCEQKVCIYEGCGKLPANYQFFTALMWWF